MKATYTDFGSGTVSPLSASAEIRLRQRHIEAEACDGYDKLRILGNKLGAIDHGAIARFSNIALEQVSGLTVRVASGGAGCRMEVREGSVQGPMLAAFDVKPTGGYNEFVELKSSITSIKKRSDVVIRFLNPGKGGLMDLDWVRFDP